MNNYFGIRMSCEDVATRFEVIPQLLKVIDFSVEYNADRTVFVVNRLSPSRHVDDAEAPHAHSHIPLSQNAFVIRPAMHKGIGHPPHLIGRDSLTLAPDDARYSAHGSLSIG
jgi:hypothetical protein